MRLSHANWLLDEKDAMLASGLNPDPANLTIDEFGFGWETRIVTNLTEWGLL